MRKLTCLTWARAVCFAIACSTAAGLSAAAAFFFLIACLALPCSATAFFASAFTSIFAACFVVTAAASTADAALLRNSFGTGKVPNFLC